MSNLSNEYTQRMDMSRNRAPMKLLKSVGGATAIGGALGLGNALLSGKQSDGYARNAGRGAITGAGVGLGGVGGVLTGGMLGTLLYYNKIKKGEPINMDVMSALMTAGGLGGGILGGRMARKLGKKNVPEYSRDPEDRRGYR